MKKPKLDTAISGNQNQVNKKKDFRPPTTESSNILARLNLSMPKPDFLRSNSVQDADTSLTSSVSLMSSLGPRDPRKRKITRTTSMISPSSASSDKQVIHFNFFINYGRYFKVFAYQRTVLTHSLIEQTFG